VDQTAVRVHEPSDRLQRDRDLVPVARAGNAAHEQVVRQHRPLLVGLDRPAFEPLAVVVDVRREDREFGVDLGERGRGVPFGGGGGRRVTLRGGQLLAHLGELGGRRPDPFVERRHLVVGPLDRGREVVGPTPGTVELLARRLELAFRAGGVGERTGRRQGRDEAQRQDRAGRAPSAPHRLVLMPLAPGAAGVPPLPSHRRAVRRA
jgi:hypothetical protein